MKDHTRGRIILFEKQILWCLKIILHHYRVHYLEVKNDAMLPPKCLHLSINIHIMNICKNISPNIMWQTLSGLQLYVIKGGESNSG